MKKLETLYDKVINEVDDLLSILAKKLYNTSGCKNYYKIGDSYPKIYISVDKKIAKDKLYVLKVGERKTVESYRQLIDSSPSYLTLAPKKIKEIIISIKSLTKEEQVLIKSLEEIKKAKKEIGIILTRELLIEKKTKK